MLSILPGGVGCMAGDVVALKVEVKSFAGTRDGVPRLLEDLERHNARATFYFSMGPDTTGKAIRRIFTCRGFFTRLLNRAIPPMYDIKTMFYGTLLPGPMIAQALPEVLRETERQGHEVGVHGWDPVLWYDYLPWLPKHLTTLEIGRAFGLFEELLGHWATTCSAPGGMVSPDSLEIQDALRLTYCSDSRGTHPFYPVMNRRRFRTLQIPTTLPLADELLGRDGVTTENVDRHYAGLVTQGAHVLTVQAELEGRALRPAFNRLLERLSGEGIRCVPLGYIAENITAAPACEIVLGEIPGRAGKVAIQGKEVR